MFSFIDFLGCESYHSFMPNIREEMGEGLKESRANFWQTAKYIVKPLNMSLVSYDALTELSRKGISRSLRENDIYGVIAGFRLVAVVLATGLAFGVDSKVGEVVGVGASVLYGVDTLVGSVRGAGINRLARKRMESVFGPDVLKD